MKKILTAAAIAALGLSLAACGSKAAESTAAAAEAETLTGSAEGFGGMVSVSLSRVGGKITEAKLTGDGETPDIGGKALAELEKQIVSANGAQIDGVSGATVTSTAAKNAVKAALGEEPATEASETSSITAEATTAAAEKTVGENGLSIGEAYTAPKSSKGFIQTVAVVQDDTVVAAYIDEFQFMPTDTEGIVGVPNSNADFGAGYAEGQVLTSKRENNRVYSDQMMQYAQSTHDIADGFDTIQKFVAGKTLAELETLAGKEDAVDAVSGATLKNTGYYIQAIVDAAKAAQMNPVVSYDGELDKLNLKVILGAAHGTKCFSTAAVLTDGENIIDSYLDEFQFVDADAQGITPIPYTDDEFKNGLAAGKTLISKRVNDAFYSALMAEKAKATHHIAEGYQLIENAVNGHSIADAEVLAGKDNAADAVSGSTLADTTNYIALIVSAAKQ